MANTLSDAKKQQVIALGQLGWALRRIEAATGVRRETAGAYLKAAGLAVRPRGRWGHPPNPAKEVSTDPETPLASPSAPSAWPLRPQRAPAASACEPYRELIALALARARNAMAIACSIPPTSSRAVRGAGALGSRASGQPPDRDAVNDAARAGSDLSATISAVGALVVSLKTPLALSWANALQHPRLSVRAYGRF